jgi:hypothetical protein
MKQIRIEQAVKLVHPGDGAARDAGQRENAAEHERDNQVNPTEYRAKLTANHWWNP